MVFTLILFNVKLFTRYYTIIFKEMQSQGKLRFFKTCQNKFMCNVIMVAENFTIFATQLLTFRGQVHTCKFIQCNKKLFIYFFNHYIFCILKTCCIVYDLFSTNYHLFYNFIFFCSNNTNFLIYDALIHTCKYQPIHL
jgi:hypothetical protein